MASYNELPIFKAVYDLLMIFYRDMRNTSRDVKFTILQDVRQEAVKLEVLIYKANASRDKLPILEEASALLVSIKIKIRIMSDLGAISKNLYALSMEKTVEISKQLSSWKKYFKDA